MLRRDTRAAHSPPARVTRVIVATMIAVVGLAALAFSIAQVTVRRDPVLAHRLAPYDGRITARLAASLVERAGTTSSASSAKAAVVTPADRERADVIAREALRQDPTAIAAVSTLGVDAAVREDLSAARRLFGYAQKLSRRDLATQLWAIEDAVGRGDIAGALRHYDIALRIDVGVSDLLFPVLASASADPAIRTALIQALAARPPWAERFVSFVAARGAEPGSTAALFLGLRRSGIALSSNAEANTVNALLSSGDPDRAWAYYAVIRPGVSRRRSRDLDSGGAAPSQFDWIGVAEGGVVATIEDGRLSFADAAGVGGSLIRQVQILPAGRYRLRGHSEGIGQANEGALYWLLTCQDGRELGRVIVPESGRDRGWFSGPLVVPPACPLQALILVTSPSDVAGGTSGLIDRVGLAQVGDGS